MLGRGLQAAREELRTLIRCGVRVRDVGHFLDSVGERVLREELSAAELELLLNLLLAFSAVENDKGGKRNPEEMVNRA